MSEKQARSHKKKYNNTTVLKTLITINSITNLSTLLNPKPPPMPKFTRTHNRASYPSSMDKIPHGFRSVWIKFDGKPKRTWNGFWLEQLEALFPCVGEVDELTLLLTENGANSFLQIEKGSMREKEREDLWERETELIDWGLWVVGWEHSGERLRAQRLRCELR